MIAELDGLPRKSCLRRSLESGWRHYCCCSRCCYCYFHCHCYCLNLASWSCCWNFRSSRRCCRNRCTTALFSADLASSCRYRSMYSTCPTVTLRGETTGKNTKRRFVCWSIGRLEACRHRRLARERRNSHRRRGTNCFRT